MQLAPLCMLMEELGLFEVLSVIEIALQTSIYIKTLKEIAFLLGEVEMWISHLLDAI